MAHSSHSRKNSKQREIINTFATPRVLLPLTIANVIAKQRLQNALQQTDKRFYNPTKINRPLTLRKTPARTNRNLLRGIYDSPFRILDPKQTGICIRRKQRRQVIFALKRTGKGSGSKRRRYTNHSNYQC